MSKNVVINYPERFKMGKGSGYNDNCWFNARGGITIGENTLFGPGVIVHSAEHVIKSIESTMNAENTNRFVTTPTVIGNDVWVGAGAIILAGSNIPDKCVIGAGTIITEKNSKRLKEGDIVVNDVRLRVLGNREQYDKDGNKEEWKIERDEK